MNQELVVAVLAAVAAVVLLAGLFQAFTPPPRRRLRRVRGRGPRAPLRRRPGAAAPGPSRPATEEKAPAGLAAAEPAPAARRARPGFTPRARPAEPEALAPPALEPSAEAPPTAESPPAPAPPVFATPPPLSVEPVAPPEPEREPVTKPRPAREAPAAELPLEECLTLYERQQYPELIAKAEPALQRALGEGSTSAPPAHEVAKLWSLLGLARQAAGDEEGARSAFEEAIHAAPEDDRATYQAQMAALATGVSRRLLARAEQVVEGAGEEQIRRLRQAMLWLHQGLEEVPEDGELRSALERARHGLWASYNQTVTALVQRQEFHRARRLIREALADEEFPADRQDHFKELLSATFTGEIGQLTASAIRTLEDERVREALSFLQRAEGTLSAVPADALTPKRREDVNRRLWWGYTKLGMQRVEAGEYEEALEPLFHALKIGEVDPERQQETREALIRALEGAADTHAAAITRLADDGNRSGAVAEMDRLKSLMRESLERGLSQHELSAALAKVRRLMERLERGSAGPTS